MKKTMKKLIASTIIFVFMCSCVFSLIVSASEGDKMVSDHFSKLNYNDNAYCPPSQMTCAYVLRSDSSEDFISCVAKYEGTHLYGVDFMPAVEEGVAKEAFKAISASVVVVGNKK